MGEASAAAAAPAKVKKAKSAATSTTSRVRKVVQSTDTEATHASAVPGEGAPVAKARKTKSTKATTTVTHRHKKTEISAAGIQVEAAPETVAVATAVTAPVLEVQTPVKAAVVVDPSHDEIAQLAYSYYVARGYQPGNPAEDWFRATAELRAKLNA